MKHSDKQGRTLRILTYNVHRWLGTDRQISPNRITDVIASCNPDIVALQEVRVGRVRPGEIDQAASVASALGMDLHFQPTIRILGEQYGIAVLARQSSRIVRCGRLPTQSTRQSFEKRSALWVAVEVEGGRLCVAGERPLGRLATAWAPPPPRASIRERFADFVRAPTEVSRRKSLLVR